MTMYFASGQREPFTDLNDALEKYPDWDMVVVRGALFYYKAMTGLGQRGIDAWVKRAETNSKLLLEIEVRAFTY